ISGTLQQVCPGRRLARHSEPGRRPWDQDREGVPARAGGGETDMGVWQNALQGLRHGTMSLPSEQQVLTLFQGTAQQQYTMKRLIQLLAVPAEERPAFREAIRAMVARGRLVRLHGTRYALPQRLDTVAGVVRRHADGYGFVVLDDENEDDVYIPRR